MKIQKILELFSGRVLCEVGVIYWDIRLSQKFCNIYICTSFQFLELEGIELMPYPAYSLDQDPSDYYFLWSMTLFLYSWHFNSSERVEALGKNKNWYQCGIKGRKVASDCATQWLLLWILSFFCCNLKNKANTWSKYFKNVDSPL